jgi:serine/threonine-protein kinase SRPK3
MCLGLRCQIWNLFEGGSLFSGQDPEFQTYRSRAHLAEMMRLLGPPSPSFLARGNLTQKFFSQEGNSSILPLSWVSY